MGRSPSIYDVAEEARVSVATASRALNRSGRVSEERRRRVLDAARALGYEPSPMARSLALGRRSSIGLVIRPGTRAYTDLFLAEVLRGISGRGAERGLSVQIVSEAEPMPEGFPVGRFLEGVDGVLLLDPAGGSRLCEEIIKRRPRAVALNRLLASIPSVTVDNAAGGAMAAGHLLSLGHERIAVIGGDEADPISRARANGASAAISSAGLDAGKILYAGYMSEAAGRMALDLLAGESPPTAFFAASDWMATGILAALADAGRRVPEEISVVGFDGSILAETSVPRLTTINQPLYELGRRAVDVLIDMISGKKGTSAVLEPSLIKGSSTGRAP